VCRCSRRSSVVEPIDSKFKFGRPGVARWFVVPTRRIVLRPPDLLETRVRYYTIHCRLISLSQEISCWNSSWTAGDRCTAVC